jgi:hypothetical protein
VTATESAGSWSAAAAYTGAGSGALGGISCWEATSCTAVGVQDLEDTVGIPSGRALAIAETGGPWNTIALGPLPVHDSPSEPNGASDPNVFRSVSCDAADTCTAAGGSSSMPMVQSGTGSDWGTQTIVQVPSGSPWSGGAFNAVACSSSDSCVAAGYYDSAYSNQAGMVSTGTG